MTPTTTGPVLMPIRKIGQPGWLAAMSRVTVRISVAARAARWAWSGWSPAALKTVSTPSPAKCSIVPPARSTMGTTAAQLAFSISTTSRGSWRSLNGVISGEVREHRGDDALVADRRDGEDVARRRTRSVTTAGR